MSDDPRGGAGDGGAGDGEADRELTLVPEVATPAQRAPGSPAPAIFVGSMLVAFLVFGPALLMLGGVERAPREPEPTVTAHAATARPTATGGAQRTSPPANAPLRVVSSSGSTAPVAGGGSGQQVTFIWVLEGAHEGDPIKIQFYAAGRMLGEREGMLDPQVYTFSTSTLRIVTTQECSTTGWQADLVEVRGRAPAGETLASVPGVACR